MIPSGWLTRTGAGALLALLLLLTLGCSRDVVSLLFDGVPAPPQPDVFCAPWLAAKQAGYSSNGAAKKNGTPRPQTSVHPPFQEKKCDDCHDRTKQSGLVAPKKELCFLCHDYIIKGTFVHAPAAGGECLACHVPHDSSYPYLLKSERAKLCSSCHAEQRLARGLHEKVAKANLVCTDCHDPHTGSNRFFLK